MPDINPIAEGANSLANSLEQTREAGKKLTKSIENIQRDGTEVALQELEARKKHKIHEEAMENSMIYRAIQEYQNQTAIIEAENTAEKEFKAKYGSKEWSKVLELKTVVEREYQESKKYYGHKLQDVRRVQFWCFFVAFVITCLLFYYDLV
jgi:hypothetical protein